jgi:hypothetical protein
MANSYTSKKLAFNNAEQFKESFYEPEPATVGYIFLGNHVAWANEASPDIIFDTVSAEKSVWDNMYAGKLITGNDVELVIPRVDWTANSVYREYDDTIELSKLLEHDPTQNLKPMYVINSERNVYKCVCNSVGELLKTGQSALSTLEPTGKNLSANGFVSKGDGYRWKYMFNVKPSNRFLSNVWIPAPISTNKLDYDVTEVTVVDGELTKIVITNPGSGYFHSNISIGAYSSGCTVLSVANTVNVSANMAVSGLGIPGGTYLSSVDTVNNRITLSNSTSASGGGTGNTLYISTRIYVEGDGSGVVAVADLSANNQVVDIDATNNGRNYSYAKVSIFGTGTGATARTILPPKYGHGFNPAKELGAENVMILSRIGDVDSTEGGLISSNTSFRQYGLLRDPYKYGLKTATNKTTANTVISQTTKVTLIAGTPFENDEFVYQGTTANNATFSGYVNNQSVNQVGLTRVRGTVSIGGVLRGANTNPLGRTVVGFVPPEFEPYTGDIMYVENIEKVQRTDGQAENIKLVIKF